ncbi:hypothetical protein [Pelobacter propionicus]|uniref:Uncharacterized protein n=1 Tax=Pelobacter propionicus (strain DSM 2379 / NBRC 103807 / OttBd1) TaxID=338966 RepID=A1AQP1_PELPD|nr:hypothetical protein [Pelobacter propionicus]ABK99661.1 hypothetical protein Ppro_2053 [Pelobacter propionicus DSM 2379]
MEMKKSVGIILFLVGAAFFYSAFTVTATEMLGEWMVDNVPDMKGQYTPKELLLAWGGLLAGLGGIIGFRKS